MKKILFLLLLTAFFGCEKKYNNVVQPKSTNFQVVSISPIDTVTYNSSDSLVTFSLTFSSVEGIGSVYLYVYGPGNNKLNDAEFYLEPDNSTSQVNDYSAKYPMSRYYPNGKYNVEYFVNLDDGSTTRVGEQNFQYKNGQNNVPPVISNLNMPDTVSIGQKFVFSVIASDSNGMGDIAQVYFELYKPDGTLSVNSQNISKFPLYDDGNFQIDSDITAGDGIFTTNLTFPTGQPTGDWTFKFHAVDRAGALSNEISKTVTVK